MPRTRRSDRSDPGLVRVPQGKGFSYRDERTGRRISSADRERIVALAIPPAWRDVWICADARGHIQATGIDDAGRRQYLYHADWRANRDRVKFDAMLRFARRLPAMRRRIEEQLAHEG